MADFRTTITPRGIGPFVDADSNVMSIGSCFADNMGNTLDDHGFRCCNNPFGVLYNPASLATVLTMCQSGKPLTEDDLSTDGVNWFSYAFHGTFSKPTAEECLSSVNRAITNASKFLNQTDVLIITLGTSFIYRLCGTGEVVSNCHKQPQHLFSRELLDHASGYRLLFDQLTSLIAQKPDLNIVVTVSPVRHLRDDPHENQISKAHLLILAEALCELSQNIRYFPAYEIMMDDLRDYRFYAEDMVHPSPLAVDYIWNAFMNWCFTERARELAARVAEIRQRRNHRPRSPGSEEHQRFEQATKEMIDALKQQFPGVKRVSG